ncbi:MAG TPA: hypothetical protein VI306_09305 [Pyrinomonadaceae bacterium]
MKKFQKLFASMMLTFVVALSTFAGDITTGVVSPPPPPPAVSSAPSDIRADKDATSESNIFVIEIGLNLLRVLAVF